MIRYEQCAGRETALIDQKSKRLHGLGCNVCFFSYNLSTFPNFKKSTVILDIISQMLRILHDLGPLQVLFLFLTLCSTLFLYSSRFIS